MAYQTSQVTWVHTWSDRTFSFRTTRPEGFTFQNGQFVTLGLRVEGRLIARAYSIVSDPAEPELEFLSIHVPEGPLTSRLVQIRTGDTVWINHKVTGSLTLRHLLPGRHLYLLATGTGVAPFISLLRGPAIWEQYQRVILVHTVRQVEELSYRDELTRRSSDRLRYVPTVTREPFAVTQRGSTLFQEGGLSTLLGLPAPDPAQDRVMLCGNPAMNRDMTAYLRSHGWTQTDYHGAGNYTVEVAFVTARNEELTSPETADET